MNRDDFNEAEQLPLPKNWTDNIKSAVVHVAALARVAFAGALSERPSPEGDACCGCTCGGCRCARLESELALLRTERDIHHARLDKIPAGKRPHLTDTHRLLALELIAARGWSLARAAKRLLVTRQTLASWLKVSNGGKNPSALLALAAPVNKFPEFVGYSVQRLKASFPLFGKERIANILARAGIAISATTVGRMLNRPPMLEPAPRAGGDGARARCRGWRGAARVLEDSHIEATQPRLERRPHSCAHPRGPVRPVDPIQRRPQLAFLLARRARIRSLLAQADRLSGVSVESDRGRDGRAARQCHQAGGHRTSPHHQRQGAQFWSREGPSEAYDAWYQRHGVKPRFGAVGKKGSIAILERFWRSMKQECTRRILVPFGIDAMYFEIDAYLCWYSTVRPHESLGGATSNEIYSGGSPGNVVRFETRPRYPTRAARGSPKVERVNHLKLRVTYLEGCRHLPCIEIERAA